MSASASSPDAVHALRSVGDHVRSAHRRRRAACALEALLVGSSAGCVCAAAAIVSRGAGVSAQALCVALLGAACAAGSWWLERQPAQVLVARELDRKLGAQGEILTAYELRDAARVSEIGLLLAARAARALEQGVRAARARLVPIPLLALALAGVALLAYALDARNAAVTTDALAALARRVEQDAQGLRTAAAGGTRAAERSADERAQLAAIIEASASVGADARAAADDPNLLEANVARLAEQLGELAPRVARDSELRSAWTQLATSVDALRHQLTRAAPGAERAAPSAERAAPGAERAAPGAERTRRTDVPAPGREASNGGEHTAHALERASTSAPAGLGSSVRATGADTAITDASSRVPSGAPGVTMPAAGSASIAGKPASTQSTPSVETGSTSALPPRAEGGLATGRWWPATYDAVVERWVEARRAARNNPSQ